MPSPQNDIDWPAQRAEAYRTARMVGGLLLALVLAGLATVTWAASAAHGSDKVTICHADQGKPGWKQITVSVDALNAHRAHQWGADMIPAPAGGCPGTTPTSEPSWTPTPTSSPSATSPSATAVPDPSPSPSTPGMSQPTASPTSSSIKPAPSSPPLPPRSMPIPSAPSTPSPSPTATPTSPSVSTATSTPSASPTSIAVVLDSATTDQLAETGAGNVVGLFLIAIGLLGSGAALWVDAERKKAGVK